MALRDDGQDVERLFTTLVEVLWAQDGAARLRQPLQVSEIYQHVVPYRVYRDRLGIDANQDYEMAVLRLLAGEGGYAAIQPDEARTMLADEAASTSPDPTIIREYAAAQVVLDPAAVRRVLAGERGFAPAGADQHENPDTSPEGNVAEPPIAVTRPGGAPVFALEPDESPARAADTIPESRPSTPVATGGSCKACGRTLPLHRPVAYCPFCGQPAGTRACPKCGEALDAGWRFCVTCGTSSSR